MSFDPPKNPDDVFDGGGGAQPSDIEKPSAEDQAEAERYQLDTVHSIASLESSRDFALKLVDKMQTNKRHWQIVCLLRTERRLQESIRKASFTDRTADHRSKWLLVRFFGWSFFGSLVALFAWAFLTGGTPENMIIAKDYAKWAIGGMMAYILGHFFERSVSKWKQG